MQLQPRAVVDALLPDSWRGEGLALRPITGGDILLLERMRCTVFSDPECQPADIFLAAYVLTKPVGQCLNDWQSGKNVALEAVFWARQNGGLNPHILLAALCELLTAAFDACIKTKLPKTEGEMDTTEVVPNPHGNGMGWLLTLIDSFSYRYTAEQVLAMPLSTAFSLLTAHRINEGMEFGEPSFYEREELDAIARQLGVTDNG